VYVNNPTSLAQWKENIRYEMAAIKEFTLRAIMINFAVRINDYHECDGLHLDDIIFKK